MRQVVQPVGGGPIEVVTAPTPIIGPTEVLVQTEATIISAGTELAVTKLAQASLVSKAKARPDLVKKVIEKAKTDGIGPTIASVRTRLEGDLPLGYSGAGRIIEVGDAVTHLRPGMRVATAGGGCANHAEFQAVPMLLCAQIPESVNSETAALATVAAIAMHGVRQADIEFGSKVLVVGLGLIGQLTARLAMAAGCDVAGVDVRPSAVARATESGVLALADKGGDTTKAILDWSRGRGADAVIITAGSGDSSIIKAVPARCRDRAVVVAVGVVGLDIDRADFFAKELAVNIGHDVAVTARRRINRVLKRVAIELFRCAHRCRWLVRTSSAKLGDKFQDQVSGNGDDDHQYQ